MTRETVGGWEEELPHLKIEKLADGTLLLTCPDPHGNGDDMVQVHPIQLRFMAEKLGLVELLSASEADHLRTINKLARRLRVLHGRIAQAHEWLWENSKHGFDQCDVNIEAWYMDATLDMANEFLAEMEEAGIVEAPRRAMPPQSGGDAKSSGNRAENPVGSRSPNPPMGAARNPPSVADRTPVEPSAKACANPSGKASAKASVKPSEPRTDSLFGGDHVG